MTVFIKTLSDLVALFLQSLRLSVSLPATVFVGLNLALVMPSFERTWLYQQLGFDDNDTPVVFVLLFAIILVSYILTVLNIPIIRFFEGYPLLNTPNGFERRDKKYREMCQLRRKIDLLNSDLAMWLEQVETEKDQFKKERAERFARAIELQLNGTNAKLSWQYPQHQTWRILPTRLGNVIAAAEEYPGQLFGIDSVTFWPFLAPILSKEGYASFIEREKANLDFLLNMAVISVVFSFEYIYLDFLMSPYAFIDFRFWLMIGVKLIVAIGLAYAFYRWAIQGALSWGFTIRVAFVLFRNQLRKKLGLRTPEDFGDENNLWEEARRYFADLEWSRGEYILMYPPSETDSESKDSDKASVAPVGSS